jgi:hypothetical protein
MIRPRDFANEDLGRIFPGVFVRMRTTTFFKIKAAAREYNLKSGWRIERYPTDIENCNPKTTCKEIG